MEKMRPTKKKALLLAAGCLALAAVVVIAIPLAVAIAGIVVWVKRRRK